MIREFLAKDLEECSKVFVEAFGNPPWNEHWEMEWAFDRLQTICNSPGFLGCVYEENGKICGAIAGRSNSFKGKRELEIIELFISPSQQSKRIGSKLLAAVEAKAREAGYSYSILLTSKTAPAFNFYLKNGFKASSEMAFMSHEL